MSFIQVNDVSDWMYHGSDYTIKVAVKEHCSVNPYDLSAVDVYLVLASTEFSDDTVLEKEGVVIDPVNGLAEFELEPDDTKDLLPRTYTMMVFIKTSSSKLVPVIHGLFGIIPAQDMEWSGP